MSIRHPAGGDLPSTAASNPCHAAHADARVCRERGSPRAAAAGAWPARAIPAADGNARASP